jgi:hypothetical protein
VPRARGLFSYRMHMTTPCAVQKDCPRGQLCFQGVCMARGEARAARARNVQLNRARRPAQPWRHAQGDARIIDEALRRVARVPKQVRCGQGGKPQWYQRVVARFLAPSSAVSRLLVAHQLGTGKTLSMLTVLAAYYRDPRPVIVIVPTQALVINFYDELLKHPTRLRAYVVACLGEPPTPLTAAYRERCVELLAKAGRVRDGRVVPHRTCPNEPAAPIRCFRMTVAGGPRFHEQAVFKVARRLGPGTGFDRCVVMVDEAHLLTQPAAWQPTQRASVARLAERLRAAREAKLALLTATPVQDDGDAVRVMRIVQGDDGAALPGYVSYFMHRLPSVFASATPADGFPRVVRVPLRGRNAQAYLAAKRPNYTVEHMATGQYWGYARLMREAAGGDFADVATKLDRIASDVAAHGQKTCVLIHRANGLEMLRDVLEAKGVRTAAAMAPKSSERAADVAATNAAAIRRFNAADNARGERVACLLLDAREFSEGVSLQAVRQLVLGDLAEGSRAPSWTRVKQRIGRALRFCAHDALPPDERSVAITLYVATHDAKPTMDEHHLEAVRAQMQRVERALCRLEDTALDRGLYGARACALAKL